MFVYYDSGDFNEKCMICFRGSKLCVEASERPRTNSQMNNRVLGISVQQFYCLEHQMEAEEYRRRLR